MNATYPLTPYKHLTPELIDSINIHHTISELRRSLEGSPWVEKVIESTYVPTLYYKKLTVDPKVNDWEIHALCRDLHKFSLKRSLDIDSDEDPECKYRSSLEWDGITGKSECYPLVTYSENQLLIFDGYINRSCLGHVVKVILTINESDFNSMKESITVDFKGLTHQIRSNTTCFDMNIDYPGQEIPLKLNWGSEYTQIYHVCVTQESVLL